ncbi:LysR family transcriptional regulator [Microbacterium paludicola]|uniref:LysR family transcriptional regulator n=1 Tax=Microbacterium paludicola TaxID=300019 RepID=UPI00119CC697|nr:LysR family transcriptional regulator [Microbacterium paludicola]
MFELRRLRLLHELALRGTIVEVARALSYSPSTVSQQLALLEREAGVALLEPDGRRVRLTAEGRLLAAHASRAIDLDEAVRAELSHAQHLPANVRLAVMPTAAEALVPRALTLLSERMPGLRLEMVELAPEHGLFELQAHGFDLVVAEQYPGHTRELRDGIDRTLLGHDPIRLAVPPSSRATKLGDLREAAWAMEPQGAAVRQWAVQQCRAAGFEPDVRFDATDLVAHARLVAAGHAAAMLPDLVWTGGRDSVRLLELPGNPVREIFAATRTSSRDNPAVQAVLGALTDALSAHVPR